MKYTIVDHENQDRKVPFEWHGEGTPTDDDVNDILTEARKGYGQQAPTPPPIPPTEPQGTGIKDFTQPAAQAPAPAGPLPGSENTPAVSQSTAVQPQKPTGYDQIDQAFGKAVPIQGKPVEQQVSEEYKTPTLGLPKEVANKYQVKDAVPGSVEWYDKLSDEQKDAVAPYISEKDKAIVEGMQQSKGQALAENVVSGMTFGLKKDPQAEALSNLKHPYVAQLGQFVGQMADFLPEGSAVSLVTQLPRIAARARTYGKVGGAIANAVTSGATMALDAMLRNKEDLSSGDPDRVDKANKAITGAAEYGLLAVAPSMSKVPGWANRVSQALLAVGMSVKDDPDALSKENIGHTLASAVTMGIFAGKGHGGVHPETDILKPTENKPIENEKFDLSRFEPKPSGDEGKTLTQEPTNGQANAEAAPQGQEKGQEGQTAHVSEITERPGETPAPTSTSEGTNVRPPEAPIQEPPAPGSTPGSESTPEGHTPERNIGGASKETGPVFGSKIKYTEDPEVNREIFKTTLKSNLRRRVLDQPGGKEQWDLVRGQKTRDKNNQVIKYTDRTKDILHAIYDYWETDDGKQELAHKFGDTKNPFQDFEDVASVAQEAKHPFEVTRMAKQAAKGPKVDEKAEQEKNDYLRQRDQELDNEPLGDGPVVAFSKTDKAEKLGRQYGLEARGKPRLDGSTKDPWSMWSAMQRIEKEKPGTFKGKNLVAFMDAFHDAKYGNDIPETKVAFSKIGQTDLFGKDKSLDQIDREERMRLEREEVKQRLAERKGGAADANLPLFQGNTAAGEGGQTSLFSKKDPNVKKLQEELKSIDDNFFKISQQRKSLTKEGFDKIWEKNESKAYAIRKKLIDLTGDAYGITKEEREVAKQHRKKMKPSGKGKYQDVLTQLLKPDKDYEEVEVVDYPSRGFLLPDGQYLSIGGYNDHRFINGKVDFGKTDEEYYHLGNDTEKMNRIMSESGIVRFIPESKVFEMETEPTQRQIRSISDFIKENGSAEVEFKNGKSATYTEDNLFELEKDIERGGVAFSKGQSKGKFTAKILQPHANRMFGKLVTVVDSEDQFPDVVKNHIESKGAQGEVKAAYDHTTGKLYVNAEHITSMKDFIQQGKHELTHLGIRISLGERLLPTFKELYKKYKDSDIGKGILDTYFGDGFNQAMPEHRLVFVDEILAKMGEENIDPGLFRRLISRLKVMLNAKFPGLNFSDTDVRAMIASAHRDAQKLGKKLEDLPEGHELQYDAQSGKWQVADQAGKVVSEDKDRVKALRNVGRETPDVYRGKGETDEDAIDARQSAITDEAQDLKVELMSLNHYGKKDEAAKVEKKIQGLSDEWDRLQKARVSLSIQAYHGSPHKFDKFDIGKIGTGEGNQSFGYGLYFTSEKDIAEHYKNKLSDDRIPDEELLKKYFKPGNIVPSYGGQDKVLSFNHNDGRGWSVTVVSVDKNGKETGRPRTHMTIPSNKQIEKVTGEAAGKTFFVTLHKGKSPNQYDYIKWDDRLNKQQLEKISTLADKEGVERLGSVKDNLINKKSKYAIPEVLKAGEYKGMAEEDILLQIQNDGDAYRALTKKFPELEGDEDWAEKVTKEVFGRTSSARSLNNLPLDGAGLYGKISQLLGSDKKASEFLLRAGIDGIDYPAGSLSGARSDARNFVVFDPNAITIESTGEPKKFKSEDEARQFYDSFNKTPGAYDADVKAGDIEFKDGVIKDKKEDKVFAFDVPAFSKKDLISKPDPEDARIAKEGIGDLTPEKGKEIAKQLGVTFKGIQQGIPKGSVKEGLPKEDFPARYMFEDTRKGDESSFVATDLENAKKELADMRKKYDDAKKPKQGQASFSLKGKDPKEILDNIPKTPPSARPSSRMASMAGRLKTLHNDVVGIGGKFSSFKEALLGWDSKNQQLAQKATNAVNYVKKFVKDKDRREAISVWREAGGDDSVLKSWAENTPDEGMRKKYELAQTLTAQEKEIGKQITDLYQKLYDRGVEYGLVERARMNYVTHLVKAEGVDEGTARLLLSGKLTQNFKFGKESAFPTIHEAETAVGKDEKGNPIRYKVLSSDAADLMGLYISEMEKTLNTRQFIKDLTTKTAKDGRPLAVPSGAIKQTENAKTGNDMLMISPRTVGKDFSDYQGINHYALNDWKWLGLDTGGNQVAIKGDLVLHPEVFKHLKNVLSHSAIRDWYDNPPNVFQWLPAKLVKAADQAQNNAKQAMFSISAFHWVQEGTHAIGHRVNPFKVPAIDLEGNQEHIDAANHGLKLKGDYDGMAAFREGVGAGPLMYKIPGLGSLLEKSSEPLFTQYIPGLKYKTYEHILERNMRRYADDIGKKKVSQDDVKYLSAQQANAAYGHLNYVDIGRDPTIQHLFRMFALAPDFLEARTRFALQGAKALIGGKGGAEQLEALATLAVLQYGASRIINKLADDDWHFDEPFKVVIGNRTYGLRSVPADLLHLFKNKNQFIQGRISPIIGKGAEHIISGRDYRGLPQSDLDFLREAFTSWLPISLRSAIPGMSTNKDVNAFDTFLSAMGIGVSRYSPLTHMYDLVDKWKKKNGVEDKQQAIYPPSKFRDLRNAVQDGHEGEVYKQWDELLKEKVAPSKLAEHFKQSIFRNFTGSHATEIKFRKSLNADEQEIYKTAMQDKQRLWKNFLKIMGERKQQEKGKEAVDDVNKDTVSTR